MSGRQYVTLRVEIFVELVFAILPITCEKKVLRNLQNIEQLRKFVPQNLMIFQLKEQT